jgi:hypothetical protein
MPYLVPGLIETLLEIRPWRLLYVLRGSWPYSNITRDKTMALDAKVLSQVTFPLDRGPSCAYKRRHGLISSNITIRPGTS